MWEGERDGEEEGGFLARTGLTAANQKGEEIALF